MTELRRALFDESDAPEDLPPDLRRLATLQAAAAALLIDHAELYKLLLERIEREGSSPELRAIALDAAGNLGSVQQALRSREDLILALAHAPGFAAYPELVVDQLFYSFTLLAAPGGDANEPPAQLDRRDPRRAHGQRPRPDVAQEPQRRCRLLRPAGHPLSDRARRRRLSAPATSHDCRRRG